VKSLFPIEDSMRFSISDELRKKGLDYSEISMIRVLENDDYSLFLKWKAAIGLRDCGSEKSIPALKGAIDAPNEDVKNSAILTIAHLVGEQEITFLASLLERKKLRKGIVLQAIAAVGSEMALQEVIAYLVKTLKTDRRPSSVKITDVEYGLIFLDRFRTEDAVSILEGYGKIWNKFDYFVQKSLRSETVFFRDFPLTGK
jgi:HEAT repeat protein